MLSPLSLGSVKFGAVNPASSRADAGAPDNATFKAPAQADSVWAALGLLCFFLSLLNMGL